MKYPQIITGVGLVVLVLLLSVKGPRQTAPTYSAATETTIQGVVSEIHNFYCPISGDEGTHLVLQTANGSIEVHVAPKRFLVGNGLSFRVGDRVEVIGSVVTYQDHEAMIARSVARGSQIVAVRQLSGKPLWAE